MESSIRASIRILLYYNYSYRLILLLYYNYYYNFFLNGKNTILMEVEISWQKVETLHAARLMLVLTE
jgi:hypothetical protein